MESAELFKNYVLHVGAIQITSSVLVTWLIMLLIIGLGWLVNCQALLEGALQAAENTIQAVLPRHSELVFPFITSLWVFILIANLIGIIPGIESPTADLSVTAGLAILVFLSVHWFGIKSLGLRNYLRHYLKPNPIMLPFHIISEISRTLALAIRLFGNIVSLQLAAFLVLMIAGFLVPIPLLILHIIEAVLQAYIFGMLALIYIAGGIQSQELRLEKETTGE